MKAIMLVSVAMEDGTTVELKGDIDLVARSFIVVGHVAAAGEFSDAHDKLLREAFKLLGGTNYKETVVRVDDDADLAGGAVN